MKTQLCELCIVLGVAAQSPAHAAAQAPDSAQAPDGQSPGDTETPDAPTAGSESPSSEDTTTSGARSVVHVVRPGETLASIAQRYYGDPRQESALVVENGLMSQGGTAIGVGMRLSIPFVSFHRVGERDSWTTLAERYYGSPDRAFLLIEVNDGVVGDQPDLGAELIIPYPLRHAAEQNEDLRSIATHYFGEAGRPRVRRLRRFNNMRSLRPTRGQLVLIPMVDLRLSAEGRRLAAAQLSEEVSGGETRALQQQINDRLPNLREHNRAGRYAEAVTLGNFLLGAGRLTGNQVVTIQRELAIAYVAVDREDLAVEAFRHALTRQPQLELDIARTSPTVRRAFQRAGERLGEEADEEADEE